MIVFSTIQWRLIALGIVLAALIALGGWLHHLGYNKGYNKHVAEVATIVAQQEADKKLIEEEQHVKTIKLQKDYYAAKSNLDVALNRLRDFPSSPCGVPTETEGSNGTNTTTGVDLDKGFFAKAMKDNLQCTKLIEWVTTQGMVD